VTNLFIQAMQKEDLIGENGMPTNSTSGMPLVDLFFKMGGARATSELELLKYFVKSFNTTPLATMRCLFYNRDIRQGQGERRTFRIFFSWLVNNYPEIAAKNLHLIPVFGRWDDVWATTFETNLFPLAADFILSGLKKGDKLCAKWMPRENKKFGKVAKELMKLWELTPRNYRLTLAGNTQVVESKMCKNKWEEINYSHVPSLAMNRYRKAFSKHDAERFVSWLEDVKSGKNNAKVNAGAIYPHQIVSPFLHNYNLKRDQADLLEEQWKALPDFMPKNKYCIPVCDVSGSMSGEPMEVSISLGLYTAQKNVGPFKNALITFSDSPDFHFLQSKKLGDMVKEISQMHWGMNTNLERTFNLILRQAIKFNVPAEEMPQYIIIFSDMQFDQCTRGRDLTAIKMIERQYNSAGYERPNIIFWNLRNSIGIPVSFDQSGTALVSGFSPSILKSVFSLNMNPLQIVIDTIGKEIYDVVSI
jgi:hypothetical protein